MKDQLNAIRAFNYFATNFTPNFINLAFDHLGPALCQHISQKWDNAYQRWGSANALSHFYRDLSNENQDILSTWILTNYKP